MIETVFAWPGVGRLLFESITRRDYPVMTAILLLVSATVVVVNLITDVLYVKVDRGCSPLPAQTGGAGR